MASWKDLRRFLERDGYKLLRHGSRDDIYIKQLEDGTILRTRVSKSTGEISPGLFAKILKQQLNVTKQYFNSKL
ncbi:type II toxin-antitoxin system HicA family toxin [Paenibacillus sp. 481]|uniref:type II toxin-antitoxin system HicA family toxin n=1 Tax=Paenibacillus sp. 481 TaxID=2835869 RepID=UPI001E62914F|nr:type II toxin-antitoxin system HicA family toxin [Paenibacillus sp. 481]UHA72107.1 type II toxin-antitoxin system HicA family toxin [Paenibacillus sp. 481]